MDDLAETLIFNMARGTGIAGLSSIKCEKDNLIRPLLCVTRAQIEEYLKQKGISHVEDETNFSDDYARNKIRHKIIPTMNEITERAVNHMASCAGQLGEIDDYLKIQTDALWDEYAVFDNEKVLIKEGITKEHPALVKRVIHRALTFIAGRARDISGVQIETVILLFEAQTGRKRDLIYNMEALREYEGVSIVVKNEENKSKKEEKLENLSLEIKDLDF